MHESTQAREVAESYKTAPVGTKLRVQCCGQDKSLMLSRELQGVKYKCFRCSEYGYIPVQPSMQELLQDRQAVLAYESNPDLVLPDLNYDFPSHAVVWLSKASITPRLWKEKIFWSPSIKRVVMPLYWEGVLEAVCTRDTSVPRPRPKYFVKYKENFCSPVYGEGTGLVVVEDVLSAIRVADSGYRSMCILGTHVNSAVLNRIVQFKCPVHVWLDGDKAGVQGRLNLIRVLKLMGAEVHAIKTSKDPKLYSKQVIQELLGRRKDEGNNH